MELADRPPLADEARAFHVGRLNRQAADQAERERNRRDYLIRTAMEDLCRVDITVSRDDLRLEGSDRLTLTYDGLTFAYDDRGQHRRMWWLHACCPLCDEEVAYPLSLHSRVEFLQAVGEALNGPLPTDVHECSQPESPEREDLPRLRTVPFDQPMCTKRERELLDGWWELLEDLSRLHHFVTTHAPEPE